MRSPSLPIAPAAGFMPRTEAGRLLLVLTGRGLETDWMTWSADDWQALLDEAATREVEPLLYASLCSSVPGPKVPPAIMQPLQEAYAVNALRNCARLAELRAILVALHAREIATIVLKGAYLAEDVYGDPALRVMSDIDILVRPRDVQAARGVLEELGYGTSGVHSVDPAPTDQYQLPAFHRPGATPVELHWDLERPSAPVRIDLEAMWRRARPAIVAGAPALRLGAGDLVLHLATHMAFHHRFGADGRSGFALRPLFDIARTIERHREEIDWVELTGSANASGQSRFVYCALEVVRRLVGTEIPPSVETLRHGERDRAVVDAVSALLTESQPLNLPFVYRQWTRAADQGQRLQIVLRALFPSRDRMRAIYGLPAGSRRVYAWYALRPFDILMRRGAVVLGIAARTRRGRDAFHQEVRRKQVVEWIEERRPSGA